MNKFLIYILLAIALQAEAQTSALAIGDSLYRLGNYSKAISYYEKENAAHANLQIARAYLALGNQDKAVEKYENIVLTNPQAQAALFELGKIYFNQNQTQKADSLFRKLIEKDSLNPQYYYELGLINTTKNLVESLKLFKKAYQIDTTYIKAIYQIGKTHLMFRKADSALAYVDKGLLLSPNAADLINIKAQSHFYEKNYYSAIEQYNRLIEINQASIFIYKDLAKCYEGTNQYELAICTHEKLLQYNEEDADVIYDMGLAYKELDAPDYAMKLIEQSIEARYYNFSREYQDIGDIYLKQKKYNQALNYFKKATDEDGNNHFLAFKVCLIVDLHFKDLNTKLNYYQNYLTKFE
ncbi:MAG: tetratricopeptide repeat protein, partial [Flavobacteriaceae bacterium]|nr:tetratricopeptide repeat protein [Flavobacteriaceae bacterium]